MHEVIKIGLSNNLKKGLSQERLAKQLNVSGQAVSKWKNDSGLPEMEMLIFLSKIFSCTIDDSTSKQEYEKHYNLMAKAYAFGTVFILLGIYVYLFTEIYFPENTKYEFVCQILLIVIDLIGVICFVYFGMIDSHFEKQKIELKDFFSENEQSEFKQKYSLATAI